ncbi:MAG: antibiotic biosynthesis monooxygenase [Sulfurimonas sp. RIFOXYD12_FULL_36_11]|uniref:putative quinol monooxygenase n=1 Tax=Sulfurimonas sp. RIFOXYB12_FULL_35_9 TaxID=1802256 RepID=UPI0008CF4C02|nr:putative quinol monooxygenase [Sulfurimonas sp. RIFOXYB12_FULL_35_9]MBS4067552.1 antibiotic biosynthesis monooxygenase [Sulfurimonas sp.]MDO8260333.1 putative quinol monooxygenase [Candidatus Magasanikbacteria bacterium]OHE06014.1 MAG: antibiotic biosynthesis monooxygenase [Sulfurimonas sp. RIFOXYB12_FULL_35_9]OHE12272.1 MAG: antibiotic biosynthesis monooxygenase [Sulfurimonas sp. RIFOXYD12_FULL_36_11]
MTITKKVTFIAKQDGIETMKKLLSAMVVPSKAEEGCIFYEIFQCKDRPEKFFAVETWRDEAALGGHKASEHYKIYKSSYEQYCEDKYSDELEVLG